MVQKLDPDIVEAVYTIISKKGQILKLDLAKSIDGVSGQLLDDILFHLKMRRGIFIKHSQGIFKDYETYQKFSRH